MNGKEVGDPAYATKLAWYGSLRDWAHASLDPAAAVLLAGDFNVAPDDRDVYDPAWRGRNLASEPERERLRGLFEPGFDDLGRGPPAMSGTVHVLGLPHGCLPSWTGTAHRSRARHRPRARRLISVEVDREERKPTSGEGKPSDHAPVIVTLRD